MNTQFSGYEYIRYSYSANLLGPNIFRAQQIYSIFVFGQCHPFIVILGGRRLNYAHSQQNWIWITNIFVLSKLAEYEYRIYSKQENWIFIFEYIIFGGYYLSIRIFEYIRVTLGLPLQKCLSWWVSVPNTDWTLFLSHILFYNQGPKLSAVFTFNKKFIIENSYSVH